MLKSAHLGDGCGLGFRYTGICQAIEGGRRSNPQAEGHAEAAREFIMIELVTKQDLQTALNALETKLGARIDALQEAINTQTLRLTVRLGGIVVAGMGILAVAIGTMGLFLRLN